MAVAISDPTLLAASSDGSTGSNGNLANLSAVANQAVCEWHDADRRLTATWCFRPAARSATAPPN